MDTIVDSYTGLRQHDIVPAECSNAYVFTLNNPSSYKIPDMWKQHCRFCTWQTEVGENGTLHLQGYLVLNPNPANKNGRTLAWMKREVDPYAHWQPRRGTHEQAAAYANKLKTRTDGPWTYGEWSDTAGPSAGGKANASKILAIKRKIDNGVPEITLYDEHFSEMLRYNKAFNVYRQVKQGTHRDWMTKCMVFWGPPGTGKSHRARQYAKSTYGDSVYHLDIHSGNNTIYWDGYTGQKCVVVDEMFGNIPITLFNKLHDKYPLNVNNKGSAYPFLAELIIWTSNEHPHMWWGKGKEPGEPSKIPLVVLNAAQRRMEGEDGAIIEMKTQYVQPPELKKPNFIDIFTEREHANVSAAIDLTADDESIGNDNIPTAPSGTLDLDTDNDIDDKTPVSADDRSNDTNHCGHKGCVNPDEHWHPEDDDDDDFVDRPLASQRSRLRRTDTTEFALTTNREKRDGRFVKPRALNQAQIIITPKKT